MREKIFTESTALMVKNVLFIVRRKNRFRVFWKERIFLIENLTTRC
jgi:hypothetical protein